MKKIITLLIITLALTSCGIKTEENKNDINISTNGIKVNTNGANIDISGEGLNMDLGDTKEINIENSSGNTEEIKVEKTNKGININIGKDGASFDGNGKKINIGKDGINLDL